MISFIIHVWQAWRLTAINSYIHTHKHTYRNWYTHTSLDILFWNIRKTLNRSIRINDILYNPYRTGMTIHINDIIFNLYITGMAIDSYSNISLQCSHVNTHTYSLTHTHHLTHTIPKQNKRKKTETTISISYLQSIYNTQDY